MFEDSLLESGNRFGGRRKAGTTFLSFCVQAMLLGVLILLPLIYTDALPIGPLTTILVAPPPPPPAPPARIPETTARHQRVETEIENGQLRTPKRIPTTVAMIREDTPPPSEEGIGVVGSNGPSSGDGVLGGPFRELLAGARPPDVRMAPPQHPVPVSQGVLEGLLIKKVTPSYPPMARTARISGSVVLHAVIDRNGSIVNLRLVQGHPMLAPPAIAAVKEWKYRPYYLNGDPVEVETVVTVIFNLSGS